MPYQEVNVLINFEVLNGHISSLRECLVPPDHLLVYMDDLESSLPTLRRDVLVLLID